MVIIQKLEMTIVLAAILLSAVAFGGCSRNEPKVDDSDGVDLKSTPFAENLPTISGSVFRTSDDQISAKESEWPTEAFTDRASKILREIKQAASSNSKVTQDDLFNHFADDSQLWVPQATERTIYEDGLNSAWRLEAPSNRLVSGKAAVYELLDQVVPKSRSAKVLMMKIIGVDSRHDQTETKIRVESTGHTETGDVQQIQTWSFRWDLSSGRPLLASATRISHDRVSNSGKKNFADRTAAIVGDSSAFREQLQSGLQYWLGRIETAHGMTYFGKFGLAVADVNGDGLDDVYVCQAAALPNRLFLQNPDGTATEKAAQFGIDLLDRTSSAIFVDLDNDGDQDLAAATMIGVLIFENMENGRFEKRAELTMPDDDLQGISAVDYDNDGDLDLYQIVDYANQTTRARQGLPSFVYHNANDGGSNRLFRNDSHGTSWIFEDVTAEVGLDKNNHRHSLGAAWQDYDNDGDQDLYVANDYGQNCLYRNDDGQFVEIAGPSGVTDFGSGMSVSWGDYDRDGNMDLYVSNMFSSAGNRISTQAQFLPNLSDQRRSIYTRFAKGNSLFRNLGDGRFEETGGQLHVEIARWAWGSLFADINNDGWEDLLVANGYLTTADTNDL